MLKGLVRHAGIAFMIAIFYSTAASAQWTPTRPIRIITPYAPGGSGDIGLRIISSKLSSAIGQPLVIDNRGGAGGEIGTALGAQAAADGYNWVLGSDAPFTVIPHMRHVRYDPIKDFEAVGLIATLPLVMVVNPSLPVKSVADIIALAKTQQLKLGSNGIGSSAHLTGELLKREAKIDLLHVPYPGVAQVITGLLGGQVDMTFSSLGPVEQQIKAGTLRAIAVTTASRVASLPDVPTLAESGYPDIDVSVWIGLLAPAHTPQDAIARANTELTNALGDPEIRQRFATLGYVPGGGSPSVLARRIQGDYEKWGQVMREAGIKE